MSLRVLIRISGNILLFAGEQIKSTSDPNMRRKNTGRYSCLSTIEY